MKVLIACERSGVVRRAFRLYGHDAFSCDLAPADDGSKFHLMEDAAFAAEAQAWDLVIAHPPCRYLSSSGLHRNTRDPARAALTAKAVDFARSFFELKSVARVAIENPVGRLGTAVRPADQWIQPWQFGHPESKNTGLWLKGLPKLRPTNVLPLPPRGYWENQTPSRQNKLGPSENREHLRAKTYEGIALAMATQWGTSWRLT